MLLLQDIHHVSWELHLCGLRNMRADDFREGNIIFEVIVYNKMTPPIEFLRSLFGVSQSDIPEYFHKILLDLRSGQSTLVHLSPSYGCELTALCASIQLVKIK